MTVVNPKSISGITSITTASGSDNLLTIHTSDANNTERLRIDSTGTTKIVTGIVTTLTATTGIVTSLSANELGIGTDNPSTELEVQSATDPKIRLQSQESGNKRLDLYVDGGQAVGTIAADQSSSQLAFRTSGAERLRIEAAGNLKSNHNLSVTGIATVGSAVTISESGIEASGIGITVANINGTQIGGRRNVVINGAMEVSQRGTSFTATGDEYTIDRFQHRVGTSYNFDTTTTQSTDHPNGFKNSLAITPDSVVTPSGSENGTISMSLEGQDVQRFAHGTSGAKPMTVSFYAKSGVSTANSGHVYSIQVRKHDSGGNRKYVLRPFTVTDSWQRFSFTFIGDTATAIRDTTDVGIEIVWQLSCGPGDLVSETGTWTSSTKFQGVSGQNNFMDDIYNQFFLTGVQLEVGSQATPFEHRSFGEELTLCQRYYYKSTQYSYPIQNPIETGQQTDGDGFLGWVFYNNTSCRSINYDHPVEMRASPTVNFYSSARVSSPTDGKMALYTQSAWVNLSANTASPNTRRLGIKGTSATNFSAGQVYLIGGGFECGAELT